MRIGAALVLLLAALSVSPVAPSADGAGRAEPRVTFFGDSVAGSLAYVPQAREILGDGLDLRLELAPCRRVASLSCPYMGTRPPSVLDVVQTSAPADLGDIVVVDVGYNETSLNYGGAMATVVQALAARGVDHVVWVELRKQTDNYREIDDAIEAQARRFPQVQVADWDAASKGQDDWFNDDGLHLKAAGAVGLALFLRPFIFAACGSACQPAKAPPGQAPTNTRLPAVHGTAAVGHVLTCTQGAWNGTAPIVFVYGWLRHGHLIPRAAGRTRRLVAADRGQRVACRVSAGNAAGSARAISKARLVRGAP
jgi:hypothetical protein